MSLLDETRHLEELMEAQAQLKAAAATIDRIANKVHCMQNVVDYAPLVWGDQIVPRIKKLKRVPILAEAEVGPNWRDSYKVKSGADIDAAMWVTRIRRSTLDADLHYKWGEEDEKKALASYPGEQSAG